MSNCERDRTPLQTREFIMNLPQYNDATQQQINYKQHRRSSPVYKGQSFYSKLKNQIPTPRQAKYRQKQIKYYHNRNYYHKKRNLQQIFKQNIRIYQQLNKQKSYYHLNFKKQKNQKKTKKSHSVSCVDYQTNKKIDIQKDFKDQILSCSKTKIQRRFSFSVGKTIKKDMEKQFIQNKVKMGKTESDFCINLKRYEKNKTQILPRGTKQINIDPPNQYSSFLQKASKCRKEQKNRISVDDKIFTESKNPTYLRLKRRPNSGFRG